MCVCGGDGRVRVEGELVGEFVGFGDDDAADFTNKWLRMRFCRLW